MPLSCVPISTAPVREKKRCASHRPVPRRAEHQNPRTKQGTTPVIPPKANRKDQRECDFALYCERNLIERFFNKIKHFRGIATRYDKLARNYLAAVQLVAAIILIN